MTIPEITDYLHRQIGSLRFSGPVSHVYNTLEYARKGYDEYIHLYGSPPKEVIFVGMNPGPWGMVQTGVPFGDVSIVRDWLGINTHIGQPADPHPKRPVHGFRCRRSEVSGTRVWGWARSRFGTPHAFFNLCFIANYCPLAFFDRDGRNITPDRLRKHDRDRLYEVCDTAIRQTVITLRGSHVIAFGSFVSERLDDVFTDGTIRLSKVTHPSPANPRANRGWADLMDNHIVTRDIIPVRDVIRSYEAD